MADKVSIIIPCYNVENYIQRCFDSIYKQTYGFDNLEVILIDDASTDGTWAKLENLKAKYPGQVVIIRNDVSLKDGGSRNRGMDLASGSYLMFVDADDYIDHTMVEKTVQRAVETGCDMVQCRFRSVYDDHGVASVCGENQFLNLENDWTKRNYILNHYAVNVFARLYKREYLARFPLRFKPGYDYEDAYFTGLILFTAGSVYYLNEELYFYYIHANSITQSAYDNKKELQIIDLQAELENEFDTLGLMEVIREHYWEEYQYYAAGKFYLDPSWRIKHRNGDQYRKFAENIAEHFPDILSNYYLTGLKSEDNREFVDYLFHHAENLGLQWEKIPNLIHISFCVHDRSGSYTRYVAAAILSILKNTKRVICFHILCDRTVSAESQNRLRQVINDYRAFIVFHFINTEELKVANSKNLEIYSIGSLFRLLIPELFPNLHKMLYLDADTMANCDIGDLWDMDISGYALAGVHDVGFENGMEKALPIRMHVVKVEEYINSGVLLMNLDKIREKGRLLELALNYINTYQKAFLPDQDALNVLFRGEILLLEWKWNAMTRYERRKESKMRQVLYHYMGQQCIFWSNPTEYDRAYLKLQEQTPWGYEPVEKDFFRGLGAAYDKISYLQKAMRAISDGSKKRIFYGINTNAMQNITNLIPLRDGDYYVEKDPIISVNHTRYGYPEKERQDIEKEEKGTFVVFALPEHLANLEKSGLKNGEDLFVIPRLLSVEQGGYIW